jgi:hypothetical protein
LAKIAENCDRNIDPRSFCFLEPAPAAEEELAPAGDEAESQQPPCDAAPATYASALQSWFPLWGGWYAQREETPQPFDLDASEANLGSIL